MPDITVTDADREAAESITPLICDDCPCDNADNAWKIARAMAPERERAIKTSADASRYLLALWSISGLIKNGVVPPEIALEIGNIIDAALKED